MIYRRIAAYGLAVGTTATALLLSLWLRELITHTLGAFFYIAIAFSTWYGGFRPGVVAIVLSMIAVNYHLMPPQHRIQAAEPGAALPLLLFLVVSLIITILSTNLQENRWKVEQLNRKLVAESADRLRTALDAAQMGLWDWNIATGEIAWSPEHERLFGLAPGGFDGCYGTFERCLHPDDRAGLNQVVERALQQHSPYQHEFRVVWADGSIHWIEGRGQGFYSDGKPVRMTGTVMAIDQRKQLESALKQSEQQFRTIFEAEPECIKIMTAEGLLQTMNPAGLAMIEAETLEAVRGQQVCPLVKQPYQRAFLDFVRRVAQGETATLEFEITSLKGTDRWLESHAVPLPALNQQASILAVTRDITERKHLELNLLQAKLELEERVTERTAELTAVNERLLIALLEQQRTQAVLTEQAQLLDLAHDAILTLDLSRTITFWSRGAEAMYGWTQAEALGQISRAFLQTQYPKALTAIEAEFLEQGYWEGELIHTNRDGEKITVLSRWVLQKDKQERPIKILEINSDITNRKQAELDLQQYAREVEDLYNNAPCGYHSLNAAGRFVRINDTELAWLGYSRDQVLGREFTEFVAPDTRAVFHENFPKFKQQGWVSNLEFKLLCRSGETRWFNLSATAIRDEAGEFLLSRSILFDISEAKQRQAERQQIELALSQSEAKFRQLAENIQDVFWITELAEQRVLYVSPAYETLWGRRRDSLYQNFRDWLDAIHPDDLPRVEQTLRDCPAQGYAYDHEYRLIHADGSTRWIRDRAFPIKNAAGETIRMAGIAEDITERQKIEELKNEFIGVISHELRTPLTAIQMSLGLLKTGIYANKPEKFNRMIEIALLDTQRLVNLVNDILDLERLESGRAVLEKTVCQADELMQQAVTGVQAIAELHQISVIVASSGASVWAAGDTIIQTLLNLLSNAIKFSPPDSVIQLSAEPQADFVLFRVQDQGRGIPPDKLETIFGRFQQVDASDSREKGGTGLGLPICRSIVERHGGKIWAESTGLGSSFCFTLPSPHPALHPALHPTVEA